MNIPGFHAEAALGPATHKYRGHTQPGLRANRSGRGVVPAQALADLGGSCYDECYNECVAADGSSSECEEQCSQACSEEAVT